MIYETLKIDGDMKDKNNLEKFLIRNNLTNYNLKKMIQIHSDIVNICNEDDIYEGDGLITNNKKDLLMVYTADCLPICFEDENKGVIAIAHAGRNGVYLKIANNVVKKMNEDFGCNKEDIKVYIGVGICKECYEVSQELANIAIKNFGEDICENRYIDLKSIVINELIKDGIKKVNIKNSNECTKCSKDKYFSYRYDNTSKRIATFIKM